VTIVGESVFEREGFGTQQKRKGLVGKLASSPTRQPSKQSQRQKAVLEISMPADFRCVSSVIDADLLPEQQLRVRLQKHSANDRPLGFYIRDGTSLRIAHDGLKKVPGIFISRVIAGGLAESCGLVNVADEVLEVNGIELAGKTLDQVDPFCLAFPCLALPCLAFPFLSLTFYSIE